MDIIKKLESIHERYKYLEERLSDPEIVSNVKEYTKTSKEYKDLQPIMNHLEDYQRYQKEVIGAEELLSSDDPEFSLFRNWRCSGLVFHWWVGDCLHIGESGSTLPKGAM